MIRATGLTVFAGGHARVRDVTLTVRCGEVTALVGPNGAGKSTLLAALSGDLSPRAGAVWLDGRPHAAWSRSARAQRLAVLNQAPEAALGLRVSDAVSIGLELAWGLLDPRRVHEALATVGLSHRAEDTVASLSGGERQRVHLARVIAQVRAAPGPMGVLLDEPTSAQDPGKLDPMLSTLRAFAHAGHAVLVVLHDLVAAAAVADRVGLMVGGALIADGPPADVLHADGLTRAYGAPLDVILAPHTGHPLVVPRLTLESR